jgi:hypothetical protein
MNILILEDDKNRQAQFTRKFFNHNVVIVSTALGAIGQLEHRSWDQLYLDHDLGGQVMVESGPGTGYEVAKWLEAHPDRMPPEVFVHSFNPVGANNIIAAIPQAVRCPGVWSS